MKRSVCSRVPRRRRVNLLWQDKAVIPPSLSPTSLPSQLVSDEPFTFPYHSTTIAQWEPDPLPHLLGVPPTPPHIVNVPLSPSIFPHPVLADSKLQSDWRCNLHPLHTPYNMPRGQADKPLSHPLDTRILTYPLICKLLCCVLTAPRSNFFQHMHPHQHFLLSVIGKESRCVEFRGHVP